MMYGKQRKDISCDVGGMVRANSKEHATYQ